MKGIFVHLRPLGKSNSAQQMKFETFLCFVLLLHKKREKETRRKKKKKSEQMPEWITNEIKNEEYDIQKWMIVRYL
jgi:hypothetical protein